MGLATRRIRRQADDLDCCTSCALAACLEALHPDWAELSPLFHYHLSRPGRFGNRGLTDLGALSGARVHGLSLAALHPYPLEVVHLGTRPAKPAIADGRRRRILSRSGERPLYRRLHSLDRQRDWKACLDRRHPIFAGIWLDEAYRDLQSAGVDTWEPTGPPGIVPGHAVAVLGYDDGRGAFIAQDSRGSGFGVGGQWYLPYRRVQTNMILDAYEVYAE